MRLREPALSRKIGGVQGAGGRTQGAEICKGRTAALPDPDGTADTAMERSKSRVSGSQRSGAQRRLTAAAAGRMLSVVAPVVLRSFAALIFFIFFAFFISFAALVSFVTFASLTLFIMVLIVHFVVFHGLSLPKFIVLPNIFNMSGK